jgi:nucleoside-diphosphate-sugar epimerase
MQHSPALAELIEALRDFTPDARMLNPSSALVYAPSTEPLDEQHALVPASPYGLSKLAQELVGGGGAGGEPAWLQRTPTWDRFR